MDTPTRYSVTSLISQRSAGLISSADFFEQLSALEFVGPDPQVPSIARRNGASNVASGLADSAGAKHQPSSPGAAMGGLPQVLTESEADAILRQPMKETVNGGLWLSSTSVAENWARSALKQVQQQDVVAPSCVHAGVTMGVTMGVPPLLTEQEATALVQELGGASRTGMLPEGEDLPWPSPVSPAEVEFRSPMQLWSGSSMSPFLVSGETLNDMKLLRSASSDELDTPVSHSVGSASRSCSSSNSAFSHRNAIWELRRDQRREDMRRQRDAKELAECSFRPAVNSVAARNSGSTGCTGDTPVGARLSAPPPSAARHSQAARRWRDQREELELRECTFTPDLSRSASSLHFSVRSLNSSTSDSASRVVEDSAIQNVDARRSPRSRSAGGQSRKDAGAIGTFSPSTNPIAPHMAGAQTYARQNVFARLSQPHPELPQESTQAVEAASSTKPQHGHQNHSASDLSRSFDDVLRQEAFYNFLQRQNEFEDDRRRRISEVEQFTSPVGRPALCNNSRKLAKQRRARQEDQERSEAGQNQAQRASSIGPDLELRTGISAKGVFSARGSGNNENGARGPLPVAFLSGIAVDSDTGGTSSARGIGKKKKEPDARISSSQKPGRPSITAAASRCPARSCSDMSSGDTRRRERHVSEMRLELRREADEKIPFTPQISDFTVSPRMRKVESKLKLLDDPDSYLQRVADERRRKEFERQWALDKKAQQELIGCTFSPQVQKGPPSFVTQMAAAHRSAQSILQESDLVDKSHSPRPEWR